MQDLNVQETELEIEKISREHNRKKRRTRAATALVAIAAFCTTYALILPAITMERSLICELPEHTHTEKCYEQVEVPESTQLTCLIEEHEHSDVCYDEAGQLVCTADEHVHADDCYVTVEAHTEETLVCQIAEHAHDDACYDAAPEPVTEPAHYCGFDYHTHGEACYDENGKIVCAIEEHTHTDECFSDPNADLDTAESWRAIAAGTALTGNRAQDLVSVASGQIGYTESSLNYSVIDGVHRGYTLYGAWSGNAYADWNAAFAAFCIEYADIPADAFYSCSDAAGWYESIKDSEVFLPADSDAACGDIIFIDCEPVDGTADEVGIVSQTNGSYIYAVEGDIEGAVVTAEYVSGDEHILGFARIPESTDEAEVIALTMLGSGTSDPNVIDNGQCGDNAYWTLYADGTFEITGTGSMYSVYKYPDSMPEWYEPYADQIKKVVIGEGITSIGSAAFAGCQNLAEVDVSDAGSITEIGANAFTDCQKLSEFDFQSLQGLKSIGSGAFLYSGLASADLHGLKGLTSIPGSTFGGTKNLSSVDLSGCTALKSIGSNSFNGSNITTLDLTGCSSLESIGTSAFHDCLSLRSVTLEGCTALARISDQAFYNCPLLEDFDFSELSALGTIGSKTFFACSSLKGLDFSGDTSLTTIGESAFCNCSSITELDLSGCSSLASIGSSAFQYCRSLKTTDFDGCISLSSIGSQAFYSCTSLQAIDMRGCDDPENPDRKLVIESMCFEGASSLKSANLPACLTSLGYRAFVNASSLEELTFGNNSPYYTDTEVDGVLYPANDSKLNYAGTQTVTASKITSLIVPFMGEDIPADPSNKSFYAYNNSLLQELIFVVNEDNRSNITFISPDFCSSSALESVALPASVREIKDGAFNNSSLIRELTFLKDQDGNCDLTTIGSAFKNLTSLEKLEIPASVSYIAPGAFNNAKNVSELYWNAESMETIDSALFNKGNGFASDYALYIGKSVDSLPVDFFKAMSACGDVFFEGENEITISAAAAASAPGPLVNLDGTYYVDADGVIYDSPDKKKLYYCPPGIEDFTVPASVTEIADEAFTLSHDLKSVSFEDASAIKYMGADAFYGIASLETVNDLATGKSATTVSAATALFTNAAIGSSTFAKTGLDSDTEEFWHDGDSVDKLDNETDSYAITIDPDDPSHFNKDGEYYSYLTGESAKLIISSKSQEPLETVCFRIFVTADNNDYTPGKSFTTNGGIKVEYKDTGNPDVKCYEFALEPGTTADFDLLFEYFSPSSAGGTICVWSDVFVGDPENWPMSIPPLNEGDEYVELNWTTDRLDREVKKALGYNNRIVSDGTGSAIAKNNEIRWNIAMAKATDENGQEDSVDEILGKDYSTKVVFHDSMTLPEGVSWDPEILSAIADGRYSFVFTSASAATLRIRDSEGKSVNVINLGFPTGAYGCEPKVYLNEAGDNFTVEWAVKSTVKDAEIPTGNCTFTVCSGTLCFDLEAIAKSQDKGSYEDLKTLSVEINNGVTADTYYTHSPVATTSASCPLTLNGTGPSISVSKTRSGTDSTSYRNYMGNSMTFTLSAENTGLVCTKEFKQIHDTLNDYLYISPENMERMFAQPETYGDDPLTLGDRLTVTIENANLYPALSGTAVAMDGSTPVAITPANSGTSLPYATKQTIKITKAEDGYLICVGDGDGEVYPSVAQGLDAIGYVVCAEDVYTVNWDFAKFDSEGNVVEPFPFNGGLKISVPVYTTQKNTFQLLQADHSCFYGYPVEITHNVSNTAQFEYQSTLNASCKTYNISHDVEIYKNMAVNGEPVTDSSKVNLGDGDELDFTLNVRNRGSAIDDTPLVDLMSGSQIMLVPAGVNKDLADKGLEVYTAENGVEYYKLSKTGTYKHVCTGRDDRGLLIYADTITVTEMEDGTWNTDIFWYFSSITAGGGGDTNYSSRTINYKTLVCSDKIQFGVKNQAWLNWKHDMQDDEVVRGDRLGETISAAGSSLSFDKQIVTANPNTDGKTTGEELDEDDFTVLSEENHTVTYKITLHASGNNPLVLTGDNIYDRLPQTFGVFDWNSDNLSLVYWTDDPELVTFTGIGDWYITSDSPNPIMWESDIKGQQYICWPEDASIVFNAGANVYLYVTLDYTDQWDDYAAQVLGVNIENTFYVNDFPENVLHEVRAAGEVVLQKGVSSIMQLGKSLSREYYNNAYSTIEYYIALYNGGTSRFYLSDLYDEMPQGFTYLASGPKWDMFRDNQGLLSSIYYPFTTYSTEKKNNNSSINLPVQMTDEKRDSVTFMAAIVKPTKTDNGVVFSIYGYEDNTQPDMIKYDPYVGRYYLAPGEAIAFCVTADIDDDCEKTLDEATNLVSMEYFDPEGCKVVKYEGAEIKGRVLNDVDYNDGSCEISGKTIYSQVTVKRGQILPGITKKLTQYKVPGADAPKDASSSAVINPSCNLYWEVDTYNDSFSEISGYTLHESMQYPYEFAGDVIYNIYDIDGAGYSAQVMNSNGTSTSPLFSIKERKSDSLKIMDINGDLHEVGYDETVTLPLPHINLAYNGTNASAYYLIDNDAIPAIGRERPYQIGTFEVTFSRQYDKNGEKESESMDIRFDKNIMVLLPGCTGKLLIETDRSVNDTTYLNTTYINTAQILPDNTDYIDKKVTKGRAIYDENKNNYGVESYGFVTVASGWATSSVKHVTELCDADNTTSSLSVDNVITLKKPDNVFRYDLKVRNLNSNYSMQKLVFIDNLPEVDDTFALRSDYYRYSDFTVNFCEDLDLVVTLTEGGNGEDETVTVLPSSSYTVEFSDINSDFTEKDWNGTADSSRWSSERTASSRSMRIIINDSTLMPGMGTITVSFNAIASGEPTSGDIAYNNFAYYYMMNNVELSATPYIVGVRVPDYPYIAKSLVDIHGSRYSVTEDTDFYFLAYDGELLDSIPENALNSDGTASEELRQALSERNYHIFTVTVPADSEKPYESGLVRLPDTDDFKWQQGEQYNLVELFIDDHYRFVNWDGASGNTLTFIYDGEDTQIFKAVNRSLEWSVELTKVSLADSEEKLSGAVFGLYSTDAAARIDDEAYADALSFELETKNGTETWYLTAVGVTGEDGLLTWSGLTDEKYHIRELKAPDGFTKLEEDIVVTRSDCGTDNTVAALTIENEPGYILPLSGGMGINSFALGGLLLMAVTLLIGCKRRRKQEGAST